MIVKVGITVTLLCMIFALTVSQLSTGPRPTGITMALGINIFYSLMGLVLQTYGYIIRNRVKRKKLDEDMDTYFL